MTARIHILLPVHNRRDITRRFIHCLKEQTFDDWHLLLIDDGSSDGTADMVREEIPDVTVLRGSGDWWWGGALEQGYRWLLSHDIPDTDVVLMINDDTEFAADFLSMGLELLAQQNSTLLLASAYSRQTRDFLDAGICIDWKRLTFRAAPSPERIDCLSTRGLFLTVGTFRENGGFHPVMLPHYGSDYEFTIRAKRRGCRLLSDSRLRLFVDQTTTGLHQLQAQSPLSCASKQFSKRTPGNPLYLSSLILLSCPWRWKLKNIIRVWAKAGTKLVGSFLPKCVTTRSC